MRFLSLTQPWATLMAIGAKRIETRSWRTHYTGPIGIHAAKGFPGWAQSTCWESPFAQALVRGGENHPDTLPRGAVVAVATLVDCILIQGPPIGDEAQFGDYTPGRWAWRVGGVSRLLVPMLATGHLGLWSDEDLSVRVTLAPRWREESRA